MRDLLVLFVQLVVTTVRRVRRVSRLAGRADGLADASWHFYGITTLDSAGVLSTSLLQAGEILYLFRSSSRYLNPGHKGAMSQIPVMAGSDPMTTRIDRTHASWSDACGHSDAAAMHDRSAPRPRRGLSLTSPEPAQRLDTRCHAGQSDFRKSATSRYTNPWCITPGALQRLHHVKRLLPVPIFDLCLRFRDGGRNSDPAPAIRENSAAAGPGPGPGSDSPFLLRQKLRWLCRILEQPNVSAQRGAHRHRAECRRRRGRFGRNRTFRHRFGRQRRGLRGGNRATERHALRYATHAHLCTRAGFPRF